MQKFTQIVCVDNTRLTQSALEILSEYSHQTVKVFDDYPTDKREIMGRIGDADCLLVSWKTPIDQEIIENASSLKYIGMCCSLIDKASANVDINAAENRGIVVRGVKDYGDEGVVEFIMSQLISLAKGMGKHQWKPQQTELKNKTLGIIGLGKIGAVVAARAQHAFMGMTKMGQAAIFETRGNQDCHAILRGGKRPNYSKLDVDAACAILKAAGLRESYRARFAERQQMLADLARKYAGDSVRTTVEQNMVLRWVNAGHHRCVRRIRDSRNRRLHRLKDARLFQKALPDRRVFKLFLFKIAGGKAVNRPDDQAVPPPLCCCTEGSAECYQKENNKKSGHGL